jgi:hypothetical protein
VRDPRLTEDCRYSYPTEGPVTYGAAVELAAQRGADLRECTARMRALRENALSLPLPGGP